MDFGRSRRSITLMIAISGLLSHVSTSAADLPNQSIKESNIRSSRGTSLRNKDVVKSLGITTDQSKRIGELQSLAEVQIDALQQAVRNGELVENSKTRRQILENCDRFMLEVLTPEQRAKLDKMKGDRR
jgi:hypothetical protein